MGINLINFYNLNWTLPISFVKNNPSTYLGKSKPGTFAKPPKSGHTPFLGVNEHFFKVGRAKLITCADKPAIIDQ